ncbi:hypothetical protein REPUB_Repub12eG0207500 [Reevesia pubescens]
MALIKSTGKSWFKNFQYEEDRDSPSDVRNLLLIVATLIATVTFQAGVNPPGGVWQDNSNGHLAGRAIYASQPPAFYVFLISNTLALSASILVIISLTYRFPFHLEVIVATISMLVTYGSAIFAVTPRESVKFRYVTAAAAVPFGIPFRTSHDIVRRSVALCVSKNCQLQGLSLDELRTLNHVFDNDVYEFLGVENAVKKFSSYGSTGSACVADQLDYWVTKLEIHRSRSH